MGAARAPLCIDSGQSVSCLDVHLSPLRGRSRGERREEQVAQRILDARCWGRMGSVMPWKSRRSPDSFHCTCWPFVTEDRWNGPGESSRAVVIRRESMSGMGELCAFACRVLPFLVILVGKYCFYFSCISAGACTCRPS